MTGRRHKDRNPFFFFIKKNRFCCSASHRQSNVSCVSLWFSVAVVLQGVCACSLFSSPPSDHCLCRGLWYQSCCLVLVLFPLHDVAPWYDEIIFYILLSEKNQIVCDVKENSALKQSESQTSDVVYFFMFMSELSELLSLMFLNLIICQLLHFYWPFWTQTRTVCIFRSFFWKQQTRDESQKQTLGCSCWLTSLLINLSINCVVCKKFSEQQVKKDAFKVWFDYDSDD